MTEEYIKRDPGDLITSEDWNEVQVEIKKDIEAKIKSAKEQIKKTGVERADNADKFDNKTPKGWTDELDERYAAKVHDHKGETVYRRYHKRFTKETRSAFLHHELGRFPLVDVYELLPFVLPVSSGGTSEVESSDGYPPKFFLYYHHEEADKFGLNAKVCQMRVPLGVPIEAVLDEYGIVWERDNTLEDVRNDLWGFGELPGLFTPPNDEISHAFSPWIKENERLKIKTLDKNNEWENIQLAFRPRKTELCWVGEDWLPCISESGESSSTKSKEAERSTGMPYYLQVTHINYETLLLEVVNADNIPSNKPLDVMVLLRI